MNRKLVVMYAATFFVACTSSTLVREPQSSSDEGGQSISILVEKSMQTCDEQYRKSIIKAGAYGSAMSTMAAGSALMFFYAGLSSTAVDARGANIPTLMTTGAYLAAAGTANVMMVAMLGEASTQYFKSALKLRDYSRLAFELGTDQKDGLATTAFIQSCVTNTIEGCESALKTFQQQAKEGSMCKDWLVQVDDYVEKNFDPKNHIEHKKQK